ncbi:hypothetical protein F4780DRAFT_636786 [Xylariomycetidae sp. FL0641]|nr:hypothetical protein F4780DRAFT_636786 [Xylariomycetidae sp. FL0641]
MLDQLPTEIINLIFGHFCLHCQQNEQHTPPDDYFRGTRQLYDEPSWYCQQRQPLLSLSLVSKYIQGLAQPILHHEFLLGYGDSWRSRSFAWDGRLLSFMRTMAQRRDLARVVKRAYIHNKLLESVNYRDALPTFKLAARALGIRVPDDWRPYALESLDKQTVEAALKAPPEQVMGCILYEYSQKPWTGKTALRKQQAVGSTLILMLLLQLPNLKHLSLQVTQECWFNSVPAAALRACRMPKIPLKTLDISSYARSDDPSVYSVRLGGQTRGIQELASGLTTLNLHMCDSVRRPQLPASMINLKVLRITYSRIRESELGGILASCSRLEEFVYQVAGPNYYDQDFHFRPSAVVRQLSHHFQTLKKLHLDFRALDISQSGDGGNIAPESGLRDFFALEELFLDLGAIYNGPKEWVSDPSLLSRLLPRNLVSLTLARDNSGMSSAFLVEVLLQLAFSVSERCLPRLKHVKLDTTMTTFDLEVATRILESLAVEVEFFECPIGEATIPEEDMRPLTRAPSATDLPDLVDDISI